MSNAKFDHFKRFVEWFNPEKKRRLCGIDNDIFKIWTWKEKSYCLSLPIYIGLNRKIIDSLKSSKKKREQKQ